MYLLLISSNNFITLSSSPDPTTNLETRNSHCSRVSEPIKYDLIRFFFFDHIYSTKLQPSSKRSNYSSFWHWLLDPVNNPFILLPETSRIFVNNCVNVNVRLHSNLHFPIKRMKNIKQLVQSNKLDIKALWFIIYSTEYNAMQQRKNHIQFGINAPGASKGNEWRSMTFGRPDNLLCN